MRQEACAIGWKPYHQLCAHTALSQVSAETGTNATLLLKYYITGLKSATEYNSKGMKLNFDNNKKHFVALLVLDSISDYQLNPILLSLFNVSLFVPTNLL